MENILVSEAITLTMFGMGFVFTFLALMVIVTNVMSLIVIKFQPAVDGSYDSDSDPLVDIDDKTRAIIEAAIKMHTQK